MGRKRSRKVSEVVLNYRIEDNDADKRAKQLLQMIEDQASAAEMAAKSAERWARSVAQTTQAERQLDSALDDTERRLRGTADEARQAAAAVEDYGDAARRARDETEAFGDVGTNISAVSGLARGVGLGGLADVGMLGADVADAFEGIGRLGPALGEMGRKATDAFNSMSGLNLSTGQFAKLAGGAVVAVAGLGAAISVALELWKQANEEAVKGIEAYIAAQEQFSDMVDDLTGEGRAETVEELNETIRENQERIDFLNRSLDQLVGGWGVLTEVADGFNARGVGTMRDEIVRLEAESREANLLLGELRGTVAENAIAANDAAEAEQRLADARDEATEAAIAAARAADEAEVNAKIDRQLELLNIERDRAKLEEDLIDLEIRNNEAKAAARQASAAAIDNLEAGFAKFLENAEGQIAQANSKAAEQRSKIERDYMQKEIKAVDNFRREELRSLQDFNRERIRRIEDLNNDLLAAEEANDVVAFIRTQRQGQQDLRRMDEDASVEERRRSEDFQSEQKERKAEAAQRLADLRKSTAQRIATIRAGITKQRDLLQEQIAAERDALQQRIEDLNRGLDIEIQTRRKAFEQALIDQAAFNAQVAALEEQRQAALLRISSRGYGAIADQISRIFAGKKATSGGGASSPVTSGYTGGSTGFTGVGALAGLAAGLSSGGKGFLGNIANSTSTIFNFNGNIGSGMSAQQIQQSVQGGTMAAINAIKGGYTLSGQL